MSDRGEAIVSKPKRAKWYASRWVIAIVALLAGMMIGSSMGSSSGSASSTTASTPPAATKSTTKSATKSTTAAKAPAAPVAKKYSDGTYLVGTDIPAGRYKGTVNGQGYWQISTDANGSDIVSNNVVTGPFYCEVKAGQYLELSGVSITSAK